MVGNEKFEADKDFELKNNFYINESKGLDDWEATIPVNKQTYATSFSWKDKVYEIKPIEKEILEFSPSEIILDLDGNWELEDLKTIVNQKEKSFCLYK